MFPQEEDIENKSKKTRSNQQWFEL